jgi:deazaflavin-dependent oxidoreductase (nitroreductase family)
MSNPFASSRWYHKLSNIFMMPVFRVVPMPHGFALLTVTGRRSGKARRRPIRAVRRNDTLYAVAALGERSDWLQNVRKEPRVRVKLGGRTQTAVAREIGDPDERRIAEEQYIDQVDRYDYIDYPSLEWGLPARRNIVEAHRRWIERGVLVAIDLADGA